MSEKDVAGNVLFIFENCFENEWMFIVVHRNVVFCYNEANARRN